MNNNSSSRWNEFVAEGELIFNYMIENYEAMINEEFIKKEFYIHPAFYGIDSESEELYETNGDDILKELIPWIQNEYSNDHLFKKSNWMPFRDAYTPYMMYLGYKKIFHYKHYYLQLIVYDLLRSCKNNKTKIDINRISFQLSFYGWKEEGKEFLQPDHRLPIPINTIIPEKYWGKPD